MIQVYNAQDIRSSVTMPEIIAAVRRAFVQLSAGDAVVPARAQIDVADGLGTTLVMPGYLAKDGGMAVKIVSVFPQNAARGLPMISALVVVVDTTTGRPVAIMDGAVLTALRTGAASGVATDLLARADCRTAAIFGAGVQGRTQLEAVCAVRAIEEAWVYDTDAGRARDFAEEMESRVEATIRVAADPDKAAKAADVICTVTTSARPVFADGSVRPGTHINAVGVFKPHMQEIPAATVARARVVVDSVHAIMEEAGDLLIPLRGGLITEEHLQTEIGEVAAGKKPGRSSDQEVTLFKSVGVAVQDVAAAALVIARCREMGLGSEIDL